MLTKTSVIADALVLVVLVAFVVIFTDRGGFAWTLAAACFISVVLSGLFATWYRTRSGHASRDLGKG